MDQYSDEELMGRCAGGDRRAMDALVRRYHAKLLDFAYRQVRDREMAADIAQQTFIRAFQSAGTWKPKASFRTWLYTIELNIVRDIYRRKKIKVESLSSDLSEESPVSDEASMEDGVLDRMASQVVWDAVWELPVNHRTAVILKFRHELTYEEIAEVMGAPAGTVKSWIHYALKKLRSTLGTLESEE